MRRSLPSLWSSELLGGLRGIQHAFSMRAGGVSRGLYESLNLSSSVGDDHGSVRENRRRYRETLASDGAAWTIAGAVHGREVAVVEHPPGLEPRRLEGMDALWTNRPGLPLLVLGADCPVLYLLDLERPDPIVGLVHAGWRGLVAGVLEAAVETAERRLSFSPGRAFAAISPSIGPCCFEVGEEVAEALRGRPGGTSAVSRASPRARPHADLQSIVLATLGSIGFPRDRVRAEGPCTRCDAERFFSHRAGTSGRGGAAIMITAA